jgi:hypothetical protein
MLLRYEIEGPRNKNDRQWAVIDNKSHTYLCFCAREEDAKQITDAMLALGK